MASTRDYSLDAKYRLEAGRILLSGIQALVRLPLDQHRADRRRGLDTATLVSGYRGSPLGGLDLALERNPDLLREHQVVFRFERSAHQCSGHDHAVPFGDEDAVDREKSARRPGRHRRIGQAFNRSLEVLKSFAGYRRAQDHRRVPECGFSKRHAQVSFSLFPFGAGDKIGLGERNQAWIYSECFHDLNMFACLRLDALGERQDEQGCSGARGTGHHRANEVFMPWRIDQVDHGVIILAIGKPCRDGQPPRFLFRQPVCVDTRQCTHE